MGVRINPCFRCPLATGCEHRNELRRRVSGIGARSVNFPCDRLAAEVRPGRRIVISHPVWYEDGGDYRRMNVPATITSITTGYRFACIVDPIEEVMFMQDGKDANKYRFRRTMRHFRIVRFLEEPDEKFCELGQLRRLDRCDVRDGECLCEQFNAATGAERVG